MDLTMTAWAGIIKKFTSLLTEQQFGLCEASSPHMIMLSPPGDNGVRQVHLFLDRIL